MEKWKLILKMEKAFDFIERMEVYGITQIAEVLLYFCIEMQHHTEGLIRFFHCMENISE